MAEFQDFGEAACAGATVAYWGSGYMTPVRDQGGRGSCLAYAICATLSATFAAQNCVNGHPNGDAIEFSKTEIMDCYSLTGAVLRDFPNYLNYVVDFGLYTEAVYPYNVIPNNCLSHQYAGNPKIGLKEWDFIDTEDEVLETLNRLPVAAIMRMYNSFYTHSGTKIYKPGRWESPLRVYHAVCVMAMERRKRRKVIKLIKNNHGLNFGAHGFGRVDSSLVTSGACVLEGD